MMFNQDRACKHKECPCGRVELRHDNYVRLNQDMGKVKKGFYHFECFKEYLAYLTEQNNT